MLVFAESLIFLFLYFAIAHAQGFEPVECSDSASVSCGSGCCFNSEQCSDGKCYSLASMPEAKWTLCSQEYKVMNYVTNAEDTYEYGYCSASGCGFGYEPKESGLAEDQCRANEGERLKGSASLTQPEPRPLVELCMGNDQYLLDDFDRCCEGLDAVSDNYGVKCVERVEPAAKCNIWESVCEGNAVYGCDSSGDYNELVQTCGEREKCKYDEARKYAYCEFDPLANVRQKASCSQYDKKCSGSSVYECNEAGAWIKKEECLPQEECREEGSWAYCKLKEAQTQECSCVDNYCTAGCGEKGGEFCNDEDECKESRIQ